MNPFLRRVLGEADKSGGVIPSDAVELDKTSDVVGKPLNPIAKVVQEPSQVPGEKEQYLTPYSALTAPDCTPDALTPIDPSKVPGSQGPEKFTAADLDDAEEAPQTGLGQEHPSLKAMDVLLGRRRMGAPAQNGAEFNNQGAIQTEEEAAAILGITTPVQESALVEAKQFAAAAIVPVMEGGSGMPEPAKQGDGRKVLDVFRKYMG